MLTFWRRIPTIFRATIAGILVASAGTIPWALLNLANQKYLPLLPWSVAVMAVYLWFLWRWLRGDGWPRSTSAARRVCLRAKAPDIDAFGMAIFAGMMGFAALMPFTLLLNRLVTLNVARPMRTPEGMPQLTAFLLIVMASIVAGVVEEAAFRGYMQGPIERRHGPAVAILVTGSLFGLAHFTHHPSVAVLAMLPYYLFVAAIYGLTAFATNSIIPGLVLHAGGDVFVLTRWWITGQGEWQLTEQPPPLVWQTGPDNAFWGALAAFVVLSGIAASLFAALVAHRPRLVADG